MEYMTLFNIVIAKSIDILKNDSIVDRLDNSTVSLVVQSALSGDEAVKGKAATRMAQGVIEKIDGKSGQRGIR